jgi:hypothetical protein
MIKRPKINMNKEKSGLVILTSALFMAAQAHASLNISSLDTGAGQYGANNGAVLTDPNWTVSLLSTDPSGQTPPGGIPNGTSYLVPNNIGFPFGYWLPNSSISSWITYSSPTQVGSDTTDDTFQYQLTFTPANSGVVDVSWLSDNTSQLFLNGGSYSDHSVGTRPSPPDASPDPNNYSTFGNWNTPIGFNVTAGTQYTVDLDVFNIGQSSGNPTGANVEFTGDVSVVPEPATLISGALLLLPFGASTLRILRKNRAV